jgi:hypothetical protein
MYQIRNGHGRAQISCQNQTALNVGFLAASKVRNFFKLLEEKTGKES